MDTKKVAYIQEKALEMRKDCLEMGYAAGSQGGHFGPALSCIEIIACLYFGVMKHNPKKPTMIDRDRFVLSKGHACLAYYSALIESGYIPKQQMYTFKQDDSFLSGHPGYHAEYGLEVASGSLGNGFSVACGIAKAGKIKHSDYSVYCVVGDGECNEGIVWEAAMTAAKYQLDNMIAIVDRNGFQLSGKTKEVMESQLEKIWHAFGWEVLTVPDGNQVESILQALNTATSSHNGKPQVIIADTVKGKGISFMEHNLAWHAAPISKELYKQAKSELAAMQAEGGNRG